MNINYLVFICFFFATLSASCQPSNDSATKQYSILRRHFLPEKLMETSGLIEFNGKVWSFNDSGGSPEIYAFSLTSDSILQTIALKNAINKDWEDIAQDDKYIYIGDFGNNLGTRDSLIIYKISKLLIPTNGNAEILPEIITYRYPEYTANKFPLTFSAFDCEALIALGDSLVVFTKDWTSGMSTIYSIPKNQGNYIARRLNTFNTQGLITGADVLGNKLVLIGYSNFMPFVWIFSTPQNMAALREKNGTRIELTALETYQTEGICVIDDYSFLISSEKTRSPAQIIELSLKHTNAK